jgi:hypothetical protein
VPVSCCRLCRRRIVQRDTLHNAALDLRFHDLRIDNRGDVLGRHEADQLDVTRISIDFDEAARRY